jgi:hypothetical protein
MSRCAYCGGHCSAHVDEKSHGICQNCLANVSPNCPESIKHAEAMRRAAEANARGRAEQLKRLDSSAEEMRSQTAAERSGK